MPETTGFTIWVTVADPSREEVFWNKCNLCVAFGVEDADGDLRFNVVAFAEHVRPFKSINWQEECSIAASRSQWTTGSKPEQSTDWMSIKKGETFELSRDWTIAQPKSDGGAPPDGFCFKSEEPASVLLGRIVEDEMTAIYFGKPGSAPGSRSLVPASKVRLWFEGFEQGAVVPFIRPGYHEIDVGGVQKKKFKLYYDQHGKWNVV